ncbi:hypothetical protein, partial [Holdemanella biformis]|uniref:hypothetical protein n=1 Tax=Holdemanella biformis TaxID=1735 RepID=UPI001C70708F
TIKCKVTKYMHIYLKSTEIARSKSNLRNSSRLFETVIIVDYNTIKCKVTKYMHIYLKSTEIARSKSNLRNSSRLFETV